MSQTPATSDAGAEPRAPRRRRLLTGDRFILAGFWSQLVLLFLVDWGTLVAFRKGLLPWYHQVGFVVVNVVLLSLTAYAWRVLKRTRNRRAR